MKTAFPNCVKRALSLVLCFAMLIGTLFVANVGVNIIADAANENIVYWDGKTKTAPTATDGVYIIDTAEKLAWLATSGGTSGKVYKVADGIDAIVMQSKEIADRFMSLTTAAEIQSFFAQYGSECVNWAASGTFEGTFDGNGVTVYGLYSKNTASGINGGLFNSLKGATVRNLGIEKSYVYVTNNAGMLTAQGNWGGVTWTGNDTDGYTTDDVGPLVTVENCVVKNCYVRGGNRGAYLGNAGYSELSFTNCLAADVIIQNISDNTIEKGYFVNGSDVRASKKVGDITYYSSSYIKTNFTNCVGGGVLPYAYASNYEYKKVTNSYTTLSDSMSGLTTNAVVKGISAKSLALNWATDAVNGAGYWHIMADDYPTPIMHNGWKDIYVYPVWNGTAEDFKKGSGTEEDPYIIENAQQLYKMVLDGGKKTDGTAAYYKVSPDVTDIYLNSVQGGTLETLKNLVSAKTVNNWTKAFNSTDYTADSDGDGLADEKAAFTGVFDGNGVTIHGLYSSNASTEGVTTAWMAWGTGFVPAVKHNAVIKNVNFDKTYINNTRSGYGGVITASIGLDSSNAGNCSSTNASFCNITVRNTYMTKGGGSTYSNIVGAYSKAGLVAAHGSPGSLTFINCLYDGVGSELIYDTNDYTAGIFSATHTASTVTLVNCVSIGTQLLTCSCQESKAKLYNSYTTDTTITTNNANDSFITISEYNSRDDLPLLNWGIWELKTFEGRVVPMPGVTNAVVSGYSTAKDMLLELVGGAGLFSYTGTKEKGTYGLYETFTGSGTEADPYLITNAQQLAIAIAAGGRNVTQKLHYKLTCDINLGSICWLDTEPVYRESEDFYEYKYVPFEGVLDGDGHTIYELNATDTYDENNDGIDDDFGALIPKLNGGTVKNLHIRNSAAKTAILGVGNGTVENCSVADSYVATQEGTLVSGGAKVQNCQFDDKYFDANGEEYVPTLDGETWYGIDDGEHTPQLVNRAKNMPYADIDGDGEGYTYGANDLAALRQHLLDVEGYEYIYGDVSGNGKTNLSDLVILVRAMADTYTDVEDGFWRNLELGNFTIFYGENDNYDAARKLELYLEAAVSGVDVKKAVSANKTVSGTDSDKTAVYVHENDVVKNPDGQLEIIVGNIANSELYATNTKATAENSYAITYDNTKGVLWLQGENFTGVEQAVLDFIEKSDASTASVYTVDSAVLSEDKQPVTIGGTTYYYAWGDEFNGIEDIDENGYGTGISEDTWLHGPMSTETGIEDGTVSYQKYYNLEYALNKDLSKLYDVNNGKLTIKRGVYGESEGSTADQLGYALLDSPIVNGETVINEAGGRIDSDDKFVAPGSINSEKSLLVKQGYFEFKASLPSDGHSFPAWWMMGDASGSNNNGFSASLYSKVYKLNPYYYGLDSSYTGDKNSIRSNDPKTYKYQLPNSYFEIDIIELMQDVLLNVPSENVYSSKSTSSSYINRNDWRKGVYDYDLTFNIHKYFDTGLVDGKYYLIDWDNYKGQSDYNAGTGYKANGSDGHQDGILSSTLGYYDFGNDTANGYTTNTGRIWYTYKDDKDKDNDKMYDTMKYSDEGHTNLTYERRYGFLWKVDSEKKTFDFTIYIWNPNPYKDNNPDSYYVESFSNITYNEASQLTALNNALPDAEIANQYLYFLIDNMYYTNNPYLSDFNENDVELFEDLLTIDNDKEKTTFDIDYLRVYQAKGRRDIVTPETENFNNNNHFGY